MDSIKEVLKKVLSDDFIKECFISYLCLLILKLIL